MIRYCAAGAFLIANFYIYHFLASQESIPVRTPLSGFPLVLSEWSCARPEILPPNVVRNLGVSDYLICTYTREQPAAQVGVYVGYHASQVRKEGGGSGETAIHPPKHCLPGSGWDIIHAEKVPLKVDGLPHAGARVNRLVVAKGEARQLVYYWYQSRGRVIADDWLKIVYLFWDRARLHRTDGSLVRFTVPVQRGSVQAAEATFRELAPQIVARLPAYVPE